MTPATMDGTDRVRRKPMMPPVAVRAPRIYEGTDRSDWRSFVNMCRSNHLDGPDSNIPY